MAKEETNALEREEQAPPLRTQSVPWRKFIAIKFNLNRSTNQNLKPRFDAFAIFTPVSDRKFDIFAGRRGRRPLPRKAVFNENRLKTKGFSLICSKTNSIY